MRHAFILSVFLVTAAGAQRPQSAGAPFEDDVRYRAEQARLPPLKPGLPGGRKEVRVWSGFGITGVQLYRATYDGSRWTTTEYSSTDAPASLHPLPWITDSCWRKRWTPVVADSFFALPSHPERPPSDMIVFDGFSLVIEVADGARYHIAGANNPDVYKSPDDERFIRLEELIFAPTAEACPVR